MHNFFVSNQRGTIAELDDLDNVPYFFGPPADYQKVCQAIMQNPNVELKINLPGNFRLNIRPGRYTHLILKYLDGKRSLREIFASARQDLQAAAPSDQELLDDFRPVYQQLNSADSLLLRHQSVDRYKTPYEMQQPVTEKYASA